MSMGAIACRGWVIEPRQLKRLVKKEFINFVQALEEEKLEFSEFAFLVESGEVGSHDIYNAWSDLQNAFNKKTKLTLECCSYDPDSGSCYDEIKDSVYIVWGMQQLTPAGKKMRNIIKECTWTTFG